MPRYLVERSFPEGLNIPANGEGAEVCRTVLLNNAEDEVTWIHSYVSDDQKKTLTSLALAACSSATGRGAGPPSGPSPGTGGIPPAAPPAPAPPQPVVTPVTQLSQQRWTSLRVTDASPAKAEAPSRKEPKTSATTERGTMA